MTNTFTQFASTTPATGGIFEALGIDWKTLILQMVAFLILVWLLGKFVYPWLMKSVDERQDNIEAVTKATAEAQAAANEAQLKVADLLKEAQLNAADIIETAKLESAASISDSAEKAQKRAQQLMLDAESEIRKEVTAAKIVLHNETLELVTLATEKVLGKVVTGKIDSELISASIKAVK